MIFSKCKIEECRKEKEEKEERKKNTKSKKMKNTKNTKNNKEHEDEKKNYEQRRCYYLPTLTYFALE